jgi:cyclic pyranopterin phosphate synthase
MLTHIDNEGRPTMVDVSDKQLTARQATAQSTILLPREVAAALVGGDIMTKKGPVLSTAIIAGTMAVKRTFELIPFCHPIPIDSIKFESRFEEEGTRLVLTCTVKNIAKTGIEMEALTGVSVAALTVYDMCKALSHEMIIAETKLMAKSGGKRDVQRS